MVQHQLAGVLGTDDAAARQRCLRGARCSPDVFPAPSSRSLHPLGYRARSRWPRPCSGRRAKLRAALDVCDLGCGTGWADAAPLCPPGWWAAPVHRHAARPGRDQVCDALHWAELVYYYLDTQPQAFDLLVSADTCPSTSVNWRRAVHRSPRRCEAGLAGRSPWKMGRPGDTAPSTHAHRSLRHHAAYLRDTLRAAGLDDRRPSPGETLRTPRRRTGEGMAGLGRQAAADLMTLPQRAKGTTTRRSVTFGAGREARHPEPTRGPVRHAAPCLGRELPSSFFRLPAAQRAVLHRIDDPPSSARWRRCNCSMLSNKPDLSPDDLLGQKVQVDIELRDGEQRHIGGYVTRFLDRRAPGQYFGYHRRTGAPWLWFLTRTNDCRIFQELSVPTSSRRSSTTTTPGQVRVRSRAATASAPVPRAVPRNRLQLRRPAARGRRHLLVLRAHRRQPQDGRWSTVCHAHDPGRLRVACPTTPPGQAPPDTDYITGWHFAREVRSGKVVLTSYDFERRPPT